MAARAAISWQSGLGGPIREDPPHRDTFRIDATLTPSSL